MMINRRDVLAGLVAGTAATALSGIPFGTAMGATPAPRVLSVVKRTIEVNGQAAGVFGLEGPAGPGLRFRAGEAFNVLLRNQTDEGTIVHWHGLTPPWSNDGVAGAPMPLIAAGAERAFDFPVGAAGTHWMHAHTLQEQLLLAAPLIVADPTDDGVDEQEVVILLHDFSFRSPEELLANLTGGAASGNHGGMGGMMDHSMMGHGGMAMDGDMGMQMDLNDIAYDAYLANDRTLDDPETIEVERGGAVRLRIINGATATAFTIDLGELEGQLIAVDGQPVHPVAGRQFPMTMGQRLDIRLRLPGEARSFPILALREGAPERTGIILKPAGASVAKLAPSGTGNGPVLDLALESRLRAVSPLAARPVDQAFAMTLGGDMAGYSWRLDLDRPITAKAGQRVEVTLANHSMMAHPMHLHGHRFQVVAIDGQPLAGAVRDTVLVPPMRSIKLAIDADNPGQWAFHCHHLYHMATGMMTTFGYAT